MRWKTGRRSSNIEDHRGQGMGGRLNVPGGIPLSLGAGRNSGCISILVILALVYFFNNGNISLSNGQLNLPDILNQSSSSGSPAANNAVSSQQNSLADFVAVVLADTEDTWQMIFQERGDSYTEPRLVLFSQHVRSACGMAQSASGPFYCPADNKLYIDLNFYAQLKSQLNSPGDFAQAYVIAHEVGHHVQTLLGISQQVAAYQNRTSKSNANQMLVRLELQADCFAGIWAHHANRSRQILEQGDLEEALNAAAQIGDDTLQKQAQGYVVPESFTHGTAEQRVKWFKRGFEVGDMTQCDTFNTQQL